MQLADPERVLEALLPHCTLEADRLGPTLASVALVAAFGAARWKEQRRLRAATCGTVTPGVERPHDHGEPLPSQGMVSRSRPLRDRRPLPRAPRATARKLSRPNRPDKGLNCEDWAPDQEWRARSR